MKRLAVALAVVGLAAAGGDASGQSTPHLYVSLPLTGALKPETQSMVKAIELAVADSGVGIDVVVLDDAGESGWTPEKTAANARRAAQDPAAIAYIGEYNSGATAVSLPILNEAGILQVSPVNAYVGLTRTEAAQDGEPDKYYPSGIRTYGRVAPADHLQAAALAKAIGEDGRKRLFVADDAEIYGDGIADMVVTRTSAKVVGDTAIDPRARRFRGLIRKIGKARPDAILFGGIARNRTARLWRAFHRAAPKARLYGPDGLVGTRFPRTTRRRTTITLAALPQRRWLPAAQSFAERSRPASGPARGRTIPPPTRRRA